MLIICGASTSTSVCVMVSFRCCRCWISPTCRMAKNDIGRRITCRRYSTVPFSASDPPMRLAYRPFRYTRTNWNTATISMPAKNQLAQSLLRPERISSRKIRVNRGVTKATNAARRAKTNVSQKAVPAPFRFFRTYERILVCWPLRSNFAVGLKVRITPVYVLMNSSIGTSTGPVSGSLRQAFPFLNPLNKTK